jgi:hypothetical protein
MKLAKVRNEWVDAYAETGEIVDEVPAHLIEEVIARAERRKVKVVEEEVEEDDLSIR